MEKLFHLTELVFLSGDDSCKRVLNNNNDKTKLNNDNFLNNRRAETKERNNFI